MSFNAFNSTSHPIVLLADWNYLLAQALEKEAVFIVRANGAYYEALDGSTGKLAYGGSGSEGATDGTDVAAVQQAAVDNAGAGIVFIKDMTLDATVTSLAGVIVVVEHDGSITYNFDNPDTELLTESNNNNIAPFYILSQPQADTTADCMNAFTADIIPKTALTKNVCSGYFGATAVSGFAGDIFGLNPLVRLALGSTGNALGIEVDLDNQQANDKGNGILVTLGIDSTFNANYGIQINSQSATAKQWNEGLVVGNCVNNAITSYDANDIILKYYNLEADTEPMAQLNSGGLWFGAGAAAAVDCGLKRNAANQFMFDTCMALATRTNTTDAGFATLVTGDGAYRWSIEAQGAQNWGDGTNPVDTNLYRGAANVLKTDDTFTALYFMPTTNYKAVDGTVGTTGTVVSADDGTFNFKNGLYVGQT